MRSRLTALIILLLAIVLISVYYQYPYMLHLLPQGAHLWRQADCMAMTQNYRQFHLPFFQPETYNLQSLHGKVAGEFPLFYFMAAQFENAALALRLIHTLCFLSGVVSTYFIAFHFLQRRLLSIFCSVLLFTSPLLVFYGNNFLSDVPSLSFAFIGWAIFLYHYEKMNPWLILAFACFTLSALLKASEGMSLVMVMLLLIRTKRQESACLPDRQGTRRIIFMTLVSCFLVLTWYYYAKSYNQKNGDSYYFLRLSPIWKLSLHDIGLGIWRMTISWSKNYFWRPTSILLLLSVYFIVRNRRKLPAELRLLIISSFVLTVFYVLVFYQKMIGHEYYYAAFYIFVLFGLIAVLKVYNFFHSENVFAHTALALFLVANIIYCKKFVSEKLSDNLYNGNLSSTEMQVFLEQHGATSDKILLSIPDDSPNKTLYLLKRKGYTEFNDYRLVLKNKKADFLILGNEALLNNVQLKPYLTDSVGNFKGIYLYKLK